MKFLAILAASIVIAVAQCGQKVPAKAWSIVVSGNTCGHLAPCGCTKPMSGGQKRRATVVAKLRKSGETLVIETGPIRCGTSRQDDIKAETLAEFLKLTGTDVVTLGHEDATMQEAIVDSVRRLSGATVLTGVGDEPFRKGPFTVHSDLPGKPTANFALAAAEQSASRAGSAFVVVTDGGVDRAAEVAKLCPTAKLVIYRSESDPDLAPRKSGTTWLVSPGGKGRFVLQMTWAGTGFELYGRHELTDQIPDDPKGTKIFSNYNARVKAEKLLEKLPRFATDKYAGTEACLSCHQQAHDVWASSSHAKALSTLEKLGQDRDPDCTGCHVVGLSSESGCTSRNGTPTLANVGCESCHGPAAKHVEEPSTRTTADAMQSCKSCHTLEHSPGFSVDKAWASIKH